MKCQCKMKQLDETYERVAWNVWERTGYGLERSGARSGGKVM